MTGSLKARHARLETKAVLNGGPLRALVDLDAAVPEPPFAVELEAKDIRLDQPLPEVKFILPLFAGAKATGTVGLEPVRLEGKGRTWEDILASLHTVRDGRVLIGEGQIRDSRFLKAMAAALRQPSLAEPRLLGGEAPFRVKDRRVEQPGTVLRTSDGEIRMSGWVAFDGALSQRTFLGGDFLRTGDRQQDRALNVLMEKGVVTEGTLDDPVTRVDMKGILEGLAKEAAKDLLRKGLEDLLKR